MRTGSNLPDINRFRFLNEYKKIFYIFQCSRYGSKHTHLSNDDPEFWRFTFHEMGTQDIPAILDKVLIFVLTMINI